MDDYLSGAEKDNDALPDLQSFTIEDRQLAWRVWRICRAVGWRWPISVILYQPEPLMSNVMTLEFLAQRIEAQNRKDKDKNHG